MRPPAPVRRIAGRLVLLIALLAAPAAAAQQTGASEAARLRSGAAQDEIPIGARCEAPGAELDIAGIGHAVYDGIEVDTAAGRARLTGGVCIEVPDVDLVLRAATFEISGLNEAADAAPVIAAERALLDVGDWRLSATALEGPLDALALREIRLASPGLVGRAVTGDLRIVDGVPEGTLREVAMATHDYLLEASVARLFDATVVLEDAVGTTCVCDAPLFVVRGESVRADLAGDGGAVIAPRLEVLGVRIPLGPRLGLGGEGPDLELPFAIAGREDLGTIAIYRGRPESGLRIELGAATEPVLWPLAVLEAEEGGDRVRLQVDGRGLLLDGRIRRPLGHGLNASAFSETILRGDEPRLRAGARLGWRHEREDDLGGTTLATTFEAAVGAEIAAEPAGVADAPGTFGAGAAAARLPLEAELRARLPVASFARIDLRAEAGATAYPGAAEPGRLRATLAPSVVLSGAGARLHLGAERRWTAGDGPFAFDAVGPRARLVADGAADLGPVRVESRVAWRLAPEEPGAEDLRLRARAELPLGGDWTLEPALRAELAGLAGGPGGEDWVEAELAAAHGEHARVSLRAREGLDPAELRDLVIAAEAPVEVDPGLRVVPYLAVDVAPWIAGGGAELHGHGVRLFLQGCCGTFVIGYRTVGEETTFELDLLLPPLDLGEPPLGEEALRNVPIGPTWRPFGGAEPAAPEGRGGPVPDPDEPGGPVPAPRGPGGPVPLPEEEPPEDEPTGGGETDPAASERAAAALATLRAVEARAARYGGRP